MKDLDCFGCTDGITFICYGTRIGIRVNDPALLARLPAYLPPGSKITSSPNAAYYYSLFVRDNSELAYELSAGKISLAQTSNLDDILDTLEKALQFFVAVSTQNKLFVHAGVVGWNGQAILIPGRSMSGKTTLVRALIQAGATYYSDEFAVLDERGYVHPFPRPLVVREGSEGQSKRYAVEALGGQAGTDPLPVGLIVVTQYASGASWSPHTLSPGQAMLMLLDHTVLARREPQRALETFRCMMPRARAIQGERGEANEIAATLLDEVEKTRQEKTPTAFHLTP